jgi:hypothetical protein
MFVYVQTYSYIHIYPYLSTCIYIHGGISYLRGWRMQCRIAGTRCSGRVRGPYGSRDWTIWSTLLRSLRLHSLIKVAMFKYIYVCWIFILIFMCVYMTRREGSRSGSFVSSMDFRCVYIDVYVYILGIYIHINMHMY